ncbi:MAG: hypothetical protein IBX50_17550, partial [Marinospirillum sp.]|uniref:hypothetical protein n=1 Tax=Marinospirillum sp. TaxID=2183934 RepID=UPI0019FC0D59
MSKTANSLKSLLEQKTGLQLDALPSFLRDGLLQGAQKNLAQLQQKLKQERFYWLVDEQSSLFLLDTSNFLIWQAQPDFNKQLNKDDASRELTSINWLGKSNWRLGMREEFWSFVNGTTNPLRKGRDYRIFDVDYWVTNEGRVDDKINPSADLSGSSYFIATNSHYQNKAATLVRDCLQHGWKLFSVALHPAIQESLLKAYEQAKPSNTDTVVSIGSIIAAQKNKENKKIQANFTKLNQQLAATPSELDQLTEGLLDSKKTLITLDSQTSPLPELTFSQLTDPHKGIWELWGQDSKLTELLGARPRNPVEDIKTWPVAIDFGTSSTVVAYEEQGRKKLLRIGVKDFNSSVQQAHFENPTVLELVNLPAALQPWQSTSYRPRLQWGDLRCSHEALASLRDNEGDTGVSASILSKIKHWALRESSDLKVKISDQVNQTEIELAPLTLRNPTKGQALQVSSEDPFDPIEAYAYFLGLAINWRQRGIFLKYYMTFPVAYPQLVKDKILASFRRGLQRSLPEPLIAQQEFDQFSVEERASEPAAFAATALPHFGIQPTPEGEAYAVFDFGGGTTDFDFGLYREPNAEEEDSGYEEVLEHFGASGDKFLGGENLLEHLAYETFKANLDLCREKKIAFTCPLDGQDFPGSELLLDKTRAAFTNTQMLMTRLRPYWEKREQNSQGIEKIKLINRAGEEVNCELQMPYERLEAFLNQRLTQGVKNFFTALHKAFSEAELSPQKIHVFLAGNASLSPQVQALFGLETKSKDTEASQQQPSSIISDWQRKLFGEQLPEFQMYAPITESPEDPYQATTKTGVALGLLDLCPGSPVAIVNRAAIKSQGEAPFDFYVGSIRRRQFKPALKRHAAYGEWQEAGPVRENTFTLV